MADQEKPTKTRKRVRPTTISDSLNESLKQAQNPNTTKKTSIEVIQETATEKKQRERKQSKRFAKPKFGLDDSAARPVGIGEGVNVDHEQVQRHMGELEESRFAREIDQDEALVNVDVNQNAAFDNIGQNDVPQIGNPEPENPNYAVALSSREIDVLKENVPQFHRIKDTPGYQQRMIRQLGRTVLRHFPTYAKMEEMCREAGVDPLGQIKTICTVTDTSEQHKRSIEQVAAWIQANGRVIDARETDFGREFGVMNGYRPREIVATTDDMTFLLVHEDENGPMGEQYYIYTFQGGNIPNLENAGAKYSYENQKKAAIAGPSTQGRVIEAKDIEIIPPKKDDGPSPF